MRRGDCVKVKGWGAATYLSSTKRTVRVRTEDGVLFFAKADVRPCPGGWGPSNPKASDAAYRDFLAGR